MNVDELAGALQGPAASRDAIEAELGELERAGRIVRNRAGLLLVAARANLLSGQVQGHRDGFGFLLPDDGGPDLFLSEHEMQKVLHGDRVLARVTGTDRRGRPEGTIVEVVERRPIRTSSAACSTNAACGSSCPKTSASARTSWCAGSPGKAKRGPGGQRRDRASSRRASSSRSAASSKCSGDRRPRHGNRNRRAQVRRAARVLGRRAEAAANAAERSARRRPRRAASTCATCRW